MLVSLLFLLSCTNNSKPSQRYPHNFQQGSADYIYNISEILGEQAVLESEEVFFSNTQTDQIADSGLTQYPPLSSKGGYPKEFLNGKNLSNLLQIETVSSGEKVVVSVVQENIEIDSSISFINKYEILDYKLLNSKASPWHEQMATLVGQEVEFKGFPNTIYYILPILEGHHLVLYKLAPKDKIPYDELPLAKRVGDLLAVPFLGYPVKYCVAEVIPDSNERETGEHKPQCEGILLSSAEYIELKEKDKQIFKYIKKPDLFPRDFFTIKEQDKQNWFYVRTIVESPDTTDGYVGFPLPTPANLVEFKPSIGKLDVLDASGYNIKEDDKIGALFIPVEWMDFQIKKDSENLHASFNEELKEDTQIKDLRYFKIQFDQLVENEFEFDGEKTIKNVFITDNFFSFYVEITGENQGAFLIKYAFLKKEANPNYVPKQWFEEDSSEFFPSFSEERTYYDTAERHNEEDHNRFLRLTRFDPKAKEIRWYFSEQTPNGENNKWVREMGHLAVELLNEAFEHAGRDSDYKIKIVLDDKNDKKVGDLRYNILNLILPEGKPSGGLLGLGPNVSNPITGEILSATANVWINQLLNIYTNIVIKYIRFQIYPPSWFLQPFSEKVTTDLKNTLYKEACNNEQACKDLPFQPLGVTPFLHEKIKAICPEVTHFIKTQEHPPYDPENLVLDDKDIINSCVKKLAFMPMLGVTLHEMLHGLGQRHVFSASVDTENFYKDYNEIEEIFGTLVSDRMKELFGDLPYMGGVKFHPQPPKYSSVMDYMSFYHPILFVPGKLDIAALRFIYFDKVDLQNGEVLEVPAGADSDLDNPQKSIKQTAKDKSDSPKHYKILCGGEKIDKNYKRETNPKQPLCKKFDYGENPLEIAVNSILYFNNQILMNKRNRYDSKKISKVSTGKFIRYINKTVGDLYKKWTEKRDELLEKNKTKMTAFAFFNENHINTYQTLIESESNNNPDFKSYYEIREPIFNYLKRLLFMPSKHCIYKKDNQYHAISLETIRDLAKADWKLYPEDSRERLINCQSPLVIDWIEQEQGQWISEVGLFKENVKYFLRPKDKDTVDEYSGFYTFWSELIHPNKPLSQLIKEPELGSEYYEQFLAYILEGTDLTPYIHPDFTDKDFFKQITDNPSDLKRVLSYKTDIRSQVGDRDISVFESTFSILESAIEDLQDDASVLEKFGWEWRDLKDMKISARDDYPFFNQVQIQLDDFKMSNWASLLPQTKSSIGDFIKNHPSTLYDSYRHLGIVIPYNLDNLPARLFRRVNEFKNCLEGEKQRGIACKDSAEKRAYIDIVESYYLPKEDGKINTGDE